jgi:hypothetical protein
MKQMMFSIVLRTVACVLMLCASVPTFGVAAQVQHTDNDLGCLSQVIDGQGTFSPTTTAEGKRNGASQQGLRRNGATLGRLLGLS